MAQTNDMTVKTWIDKKSTESIGTSAEAQAFESELLKSFGKNDLLSSVADTYSKSDIKNMLKKGPFFIPFVQALKPFWDKEAQSAQKAQGGAKEKNLAARLFDELEKYRAKSNAATKATSQYGDDSQYSSGSESSGGNRNFGHRFESHNNYYSYQPVNVIHQNVYNNNGSLPSITTSLVETHDHRLTAVAGDKNNDNISSNNSKINKNESSNINKEHNNNRDSEKEEERFSRLLKEYKLSLCKKEFSQNGITSRDDFKNLSYGQVKQIELKLPKFKRKQFIKLVGDVSQVWKDYKKNQDCKNKRNNRIPNAKNNINNFYGGHGEYSHRGGFESVGGNRNFGHGFESHNNSYYSYQASAMQQAQAQTRERAQDLKQAQEQYKALLQALEQAQAQLNAKAQALGQAQAQERAAAAAVQAQAQAQAQARARAQAHGRQDEELMNFMSMPGNRVGVAGAANLADVEISAQMGRAQIGGVGVGNERNNMTLQLGVIPTQNDVANVGNMNNMNMYNMNNMKNNLYYNNNNNKNDFMNMNMNVNSNNSNKNNMNSRHDSVSCGGFGSHGHLFQQYASNRVTQGESPQHEAPQGH